MNRRQVVETFLETEVCQVIAADLIAQEGQKLFIRLEERLLPAGVENVMALFHLRLELASQASSFYISALT